MPPVEWSDLGYQGVAGPSPDLAWMLLIDPRFGLLVNTPVIILALGAPFLAARGSFLPRRESLLMCAVGVLFLLFFSSVHYTRLQYITGIRYMVPVIPFLVLAAIPLLLRLPRALTYGIVVVSVIINWGLAMGRPLNDEGSIVESLARIYLGGFQLPALNTLSRMSASYVPGASSFSAGVVLVVTGIVLYAVWTVKRPWRGLVNDEGEIAR
jgi:hypothetical protein